MWRERLVKSLPYILILLTAAGLAITEDVWVAIVALVGMWLLPTPLPTPPVGESETVPDTTGFEWQQRQRDINAASKAKATAPYRGEYTNPDTGSVMERHPCHVMHGAAESHVLGCEGWLRD